MSSNQAQPGNAPSSFGAQPEEGQSTPGCCHQCGLPLSDNPHPDAGKPPHYLEVGCQKECIPCLVLNRHRWATRAMKAEKELRELKQAALVATEATAPSASMLPETYL